MTEVTIPISKLIEANTASKTLSADPNLIWFPMTSEGKTKKINMGELITYINLKNSLASSTIKLRIESGSGLEIEGSKPGGVVSLTLSDTNEYKISDKITYSLANTANATANFANTTAHNAFKKANSAYDLASTANTTAVLAYTKANSAYDLASTANTTAVLAYTKANSAYDLASTANTTANLANTKINAHVGSTGGHPTATSTYNGFMSSADKQKLDKCVIINTENGLYGGSISAKTDYTIGANSASTTTKGVVRLNDTITSTSKTEAATANSVNWLNEMIQKITLPTGIKITEDAANNVIKFGTFYVKFGVSYGAGGTTKEATTDGYVGYSTIYTPAGTGIVETCILSLVRKSSTGGSDTSDAATHRKVYVRPKWDQPAKAPSITFQAFVEAADANIADTILNKHDISYIIIGRLN